MKKKKYTPNDFWMFVTSDNAMNFLVLDSKRENKYLVFNWDLSDEEIAEIVEKFNTDGLSDLDFEQNEWGSGDYTFVEAKMSRDVDTLRRDLIAEGYTDTILLR